MVEISQGPGYKKFQQFIGRSEISVRKFEFRQSNAGTTDLGHVEFGGFLESQNHIEPILSGQDERAVQGGEDR